MSGQGEGVTYSGDKNGETIQYIFSIFYCKSPLTSSRNDRSGKEVLVVGQEQSSWCEISRAGTFRSIHRNFFCFSAKLVVELGGDQHHTHEGKEYDIHRDRFLKGYGLTVVRFSTKNF